MEVLNLIGWIGKGPKTLAEALDWLIVSAANMGVVEVLIAIYS